MRLTNAQKEQIVATAIKDQIDPAWEKAFERLTSVAVEAKENRYDNATKKWISDAPPGALAKHNDVILCVAESELRYRNKAGSIRRHIPTAPYPTLYKDLRSSQIYLTGNLAKKALRAVAALEKVNDQRTELTTTLNAALAACNTHKQLQENYPCLAKYLPTTASASTALAITNSDVEKLLKRKVAEK